MGGRNPRLSYLSPRLLRLSYFGHLNGWEKPKAVLSKSEVTQAVLPGQRIPRLSYLGQRLRRLCYIGVRYYIGCLIRVSGYLGCQIWNDLKEFFFESQDLIPFNFCKELSKNLNVLNF